MFGYEEVSNSLLTPLVELNLTPEFGAKTFLQIYFSQNLPGKILRLLHDLVKIRSNPVSADPWARDCAQQVMMKD